MENGNFKLSMETAAFLVGREFGLNVDEEVYSAFYSKDKQIFGATLGACTISVMYDRVRAEGLIRMVIGDYVVYDFTDDKTPAIERFFDTRTLEEVRSAKWQDAQKAREAEAKLRLEKKRRQELRNDIENGNFKLSMETAAFLVEREFGLDVDEEDGNFKLSMETEMSSLTRKFRDVDKEFDEDKKFFVVRLGSYSIVVRYDEVRYDNDPRGSRGFISLLLIDGDFRHGGPKDIIRFFDPVTLKEVPSVKWQAAEEDWEAETRIRLRKLTAGENEQRQEKIVEFAMRVLDGKCSPQETEALREMLDRLL